MDQINEGELCFSLLQLLLLVPYEKYKSPPNLTPQLDAVNEKIKLILKGSQNKIISSSEYVPLLFSSGSREILSTFPSEDLTSVLDSFVSEIWSNFHKYYGDHILSQLNLLIVAISLLQNFVQLNYTGPAIEYSSSDLLFPNIDTQLLQREAVKALGISGQTSYDLMMDPLFLILSCLMFEKLMGADKQASLIGKRNEANVEELIIKNEEMVLGESIGSIRASVQWWRFRAIQVQSSLFNEPISVLNSVASLLLTSYVVSELTATCHESPELQKEAQLVYYLESARAGIHSQMEHLSIPLLGKARKVSNFTFVLTGAKSKRTKFQEFTTAGLIVLAMSQNNQQEDLQYDELPESLDLNSDLLLERPHYESIDDIDVLESEQKKIKLDDELESSFEEKLLPIAFRKEAIPQLLKSLDPNKQPKLNDLDNLQLLLRLTTLKQTSPSNDALVIEELLALVSRVLYCPQGSVNWSVFSRALWERSILETNKAKTVERGILQMQSLVEELGTKIKTRFIPQAKEDSRNSSDVSPAAARLRYIHQLTLMPQWSMDAILAEKYMTLGIIRSAVEIYERLNMHCEAALCYASVGEEKTAEDLILKRLDEVPDDARAISILGNIRQDPNLWLKSWEIGRYPKAKDALAQYFYKPPPGSGIASNIDTAIIHLHDSLTINPISYENWFFYGCLGLESGQFELAAEAFTRCVSLDDTNSHAWSNLATSLIRTNKTREAFNALKKAIRCAGESKKSWRIYENYLIVAAKLNEWSDVLIASKELVGLRHQTAGEGAIDIPVVEKLVEILVATEYPTNESTRLTHYQSSCIDFVCNILPSVITTSARSWRIVARVELWRQKPWAALDCYEKAYRALSHLPELGTNEEAWNEAVESCSDLVAAYESLGELPGKHGAGDLVCQDWRYKSRTTVRSLISKGKSSWEDSKGWDRLQELKEGLTS